MDANYTRTNIDDFLTVRGYNAGGYYGQGQGLYPGNSVLAAQAHADGTAVKEGIDCNAKLCSAGLDRISDQAEEGRRVAQFTDIKDNMFRNSLDVNNRITAIELNALREASDFKALLAQCCCDTQKAIAEAAKDAALCCCEAKLEAQKIACETQKLVSAEGSMTRALILEVEARSNADKLAECRSQLNQAQTIAAITEKCCPPPCPCP